MSSSLGRYAPSVNYMPQKEPCLLPFFAKEIRNLILKSLSFALIQKSVNSLVRDVVVEWDFSSSDIMIPFLRSLDSHPPVSFYLLKFGMNKKLFRTTV